MILIEGMDGSGKSILAKTLDDMMPEHKMIGSLGVPNNPHDAVNRVLGELMATDRNVILDRSQSVSQWVYGKYNLDDESGELNLIRTVEFFMHKKPFFIYCEPPAKDFWLKRIKEKHSKELSSVYSENYNNILYKYRRIVKMFEPDFVWNWEYRDTMMKELIEQIQIKVINN